ncbi:MAG TPA: hypothetical protein VFM29_05225 [Vicinamibacteria bacterium]|nr:hypothetical protein [Vicinamibacteria bacterium]
MPGALDRALLAPLIWGAAALFLWWGRVPAHWRRTLALATSAAGLVLLMIALNTEGQRESPTAAWFPMTERYITGYSSASAGLPYYVLTGVCLLLGTAGLVLPEGVAATVDRHRLATAVLLSYAVTAMRFSLERVAAPAAWAVAVGITWLPPVIGIFFAQKAREEGRRFLSIVRPLLAYALLVRSAVALLMVVSTTWRLGSHYDLSGFTRIRIPFTHDLRVFPPGSAEQVLYLGVIPQLTFYVVHTLVGGLIGGGVYLLLRRAWEARHPVQALRTPIEWEPASQDR